MRALTLITVNELISWGRDSRRNTQSHTHRWRMCDLIVCVCVRDDREDRTLRQVKYSSHSHMSLFFVVICILMTYTTPI